MPEPTNASRAVPVLFASEPIVLPGMVVPIELDDAARAAVDAAQASESGKLLIAPRLDDRYPTYGVLASIVQVGRIPGGGAAAVVKGERRAHIGSGTTGPGAALWPFSCRLISFCFLSRSACCGLPRRRFFSSVRIIEESLLEHNYARASSLTKWE